MALLLGATALTGILAAHHDVALAQNMVIHDGAQGDSGADFIGQADADDGHAPSGPVIFTNTAPQNAAGNAVAGSAKGGRGGDGGTALNFVLGVPPVEIQGGDGGNGATGGMVDITNTATLTANGGHGVLADARGGDGGHAGWGAALGLSDGGDGGNGGKGGSAKATTTATSVITTTGSGANGISVLASGGDNGNGGTGGAIGAGIGGTGGRGGDGGSAIAITAGNVDTYGDAAKGILVRSAGGAGGDGRDGKGLFGGGGNGGNPDSRTARFIAGTPRPHVPPSGLAALELGRLLGSLAFQRRRHRTYASRLPEPAPSQTLDVTEQLQPSDSRAWRPCIVSVCRGSRFRPADRCGSATGCRWAYSACLTCAASTDFSSATSSLCWRVPVLRRTRVR